MPGSTSYAKTINSRIDKLLENLSADFTIDKFSKSPARFNLKKLEWFNAQYIKMLPLMEFAYRADKLKLDKKYESKNLRVGDYVYLVDLEMQMAFGEIWDKVWPDADSFFYPLGGGRDEYESSLDCACREVLEETNGQLHIQPDKLIKIATRQHLFEKPTSISDQDWDGKEFNIYFCEVKYENIKDCNGDGVAKCNWISLDKVISENQYLTFPIWQNFCLENDLACFEPSESILNKLLSYRLDQNRITKLNEIGSESECIWNYQACLTESLKWKKISLEQSLENLKEVYEQFINNESLWSEFGGQIESKLAFYNRGELEKYLELGTNWWETRVKEYLVNNNKDFGEYLWSLRLALSGKERSPSAFEIITILGKEESCRRVERYLE